MKSQVGQPEGHPCALSPALQISSQGQPENLASLLCVGGEGVALKEGHWGQLDCELGQL